MRRSLLISLLVLGALVGVQAGMAQGAPKAEPLQVVCGGDTFAVITKGSANSFWTVDTSGGTSKTPGHLKELSVRIYSGNLTTEPSTDPVFSFEKSYGNRVGQGETRHCTGHLLDTSDPAGPATAFFDVDVTGL